MTPYLSIESLSVAYGATTVLDRVSLGVARGEMIALLGSSGCGKTSLLRAIAGFVTPSTGTIRVDGVDITHLPPEKRATAMMFQSYALWPHMNVAANIGYGLRMRGWKADAIAARVAEMLKLLQLDGYEGRSVTELSGGQRQRVALGRALAVDPHLLLLDEPMSNLDYKVRLELRHELRALQRRIGITAVYVTHDREEALTLADRIAVIDAGKIVQVGAPEQIFHHPESAFVAGFMGADNALDVAPSQAHLKTRWRGLILFAFLLPQAIPNIPIYVNIARIFYEIGLNGTIIGVVLVHAAHGLVLAVWIASAAFAAVDISLEEVSRNMGATPWLCFRTVTLPLAAPGLIASAIFVFLESLDEFTGTYFVGVPDVTTLPLLMFNASMGGNYQIASITALLLLVPSIAFMFVVERFLKADVLAGVGR